MKNPSQTLFVSFLSLLIINCGGGSSSSNTTPPPADAIFFSDVNLRSALVAEYDSNSDGHINTSEVSSITNINISNRSIYKLNGIENLTALEVIDCSGNNIDSITKLTQLTNLSEVYCSNNLISLEDCDDIATLENTLTTFQYAQQKDGYTLQCGNLELLANIPYQLQGNDIWGFEQDGIQYALAGDIANVYIIKITETAPYAETVATLSRSGATSRWGENRYYQGYVYIGSEGGDVIIYDVSDINNPRLVKSNAGIGTSHNISIYQNYLLIFGQGNGTKFYDISNPENPVYIRTIGSLYVHDGVAMHDRLYVAQGSFASSNSNRFTVYNIADLNNPQKIIDQQYPYGYCHNIWPTADGNYIVVTGEESLQNQLSFWNISDTSNPQFIKGFNLAGGSIAHNAFIKDNTVYVAHYSRGFVKIDFSNRNNPTVVDVYDSYPTSNIGEAWVGGWGVYPFSGINNYIYYSDIQTGFYLFKEN